MANTPTDTYTHGHHKSVVGQHARRTAEADAAYLLPSLQPGMRLLDIGCGPGTITTGLARAVDPGAVTGIDVAADVIETAREHLASTGLTNVRFETASVYELPYADGSFEAVHAHQVLQHLTKPVEALREAYRVLAPGGIAGVRDADYATMVAGPKTPLLERWRELYHAVGYRNGAEPDAGRYLQQWMREAGFIDTKVTGTPVIFSEPASIQNWGYSWSERIVASAIAGQAVEYGLATREELEAISVAWREWADNPAAFFMYVNVEVTGRKPG